MADQTIDMARLSAKHTSPESRRRVRRRHLAEIRLRIYGIAAIAIAITALVVLMSTIIAKTLSVTHEYYLTIPVEVEVSDRERERIDDANPRLVPSLDKVVRTGMIETTGQEIGRRERRELSSLLSTDAGLELGKMVKSDPALIGKEVIFDALLDDQVQLYMTGDFGTLTDAGTAGAVDIQPGEAEGEVVIRVQSASMAAAREAMRADRAKEARAARRNAQNQERAVAETEARLAQTTGDEDRATLQAALDSFRAAAAQFNATADAALDKATAQDAAFELRTDDPSVFIRAGGGWIKVTGMAPERMTGTIMSPLERTGDYADGQWQALLMEQPEGVRKISDRQLVWLENFRAEGKIHAEFNWRLLTSSDSSNAELAGIWGALVGSFWTMIVTFSIAFPIGVMASIYLEEFAPKNRMTQLIEVNINNLAAVPSIVFGLLGITVLITGVQLFGVELSGGLLKTITDDPRSTPLAGGVVLALMSLPTIIIAARASIKAVPPSIRDAALGLGASKLQTSTHHVLPLAMPGILTGSIIAMAQALGETAPLIIVGMNAFIQDPPAGPLDKANVLPSLIYLWNNQSERLFDGKTAAAISVLLIFLVLMNALAVLLRKRFERRW